VEHLKVAHIISTNSINLGTEKAIFIKRALLTRTGTLRTQKWSGCYDIDMRMRRQLRTIRAPTVGTDSAAMGYFVCASSCITCNPLTPNDHYIGRTAPLTSKCCILYIYSTNIGTEYF